MKIKIELKGDGELRATIAKMSKEIADEVKRETYASGLEVQKRAKERLREFSAWDTGNLANSILVDMVDDGKNAEIGPVAPYGPYVEYGTRPHFPPPDALEGWAKRHGFDSTWPICLAIQRRGIRPRPYLFPAYEDVIKDFLERIKKILEKK